MPLVEEDQARENINKLDMRKTSCDAPASAEGSWQTSLQGQFQYFLIDCGN